MEINNFLVIVTILLKVFFVSWWVTRFDLFKVILNKMSDNNLFSIILKKIFLCMMCTSFWITLIYSFDLSLACLSAFIGCWYEKTLGHEEKKIRLD